VSLLILPAIISMRDNDLRYLIAGGALLVLAVAIAYSKRAGGGFGEESDIVAEAMAEEGLPEGVSAGE
jgi:hypothetical protein